VGLSLGAEEILLSSWFLKKERTLQKE